ncbi:hypothetical protein NOVO_00580 [Rickettsiales bacterium Ac37b]|nr:hypothetical protein NOVO_00580 [Rickettsiales bacterium Ac37b]
MSLEDELFTKFNENIFKIANDTDQLLQKLFQQNLLQKNKTEELALIKRETKAQVAKEITNLLNKENIHLQLFYNSKESKFKLAIADNDYKNLITELINNSQTFPLDILTNLSNNKLLNSSIKQIDNIENELEKQFELMEKHINHAIDIYNKDKFQKHFVETINISAAVLMSLIGITAFTICTAALTISISAEIVTTGGVVGVLLSVIGSNLNLEAILSFPSAENINNISSLSAVGLIIMSVFDIKQQAVNEYALEKFNKEYTHFLNSMESIAQNLFNTSNDLIKEYGYLSNLIPNNKYNSQIIS